MGLMAGTTRQAADRIDLIERSLDPIKPCVLPEGSTAFIPDEMRSATGTVYYLMHDSGSIEFLRGFSEVDAEVLQRGLRHVKVTAEVPGPRHSWGRGCRARFAKIVSDTRRDALYSYLLRSVCRTGEWGQWETRASFRAKQVSTSESCDVALEALCDVEANVVSEIDTRGMAADVRTAVQLAKTEFGTLSSIGLSIVHDPEIAERKRIKMTLYVSGTPERVLKDETRFEAKLHEALGVGSCEEVVLDYRWIR